VSCFDFVETLAMSDFDEFERRLAGAIRSEADQGLRRFDPATIARVAVTRSQKPAPRIPWRLSKPNMAIRLATAAMIAILAVGGAYLLTRPSHSTVGGPSPTPAQSSAVPVPVAGGCGGTQVFAGPGPDANLGLSDNPWAAATPTDAGIVGYFWYPPPEVLFATDPTGDSPKVLWISHSEQAGQLSVTAHPLGASVPVVRFAFGAATSPAGNYPSLIALPSPGCWHFDLAIGATRATMDLMVASARPPASSSPSPSRPGSSTPPADLPICQTSQLAITTTNSGAAGGMVGVYLRFINRGNRACSLHGWPTVTGVTASGATTTARNDPVGYLPFPDTPIQTVSLMPGDDAFAALSGGDNSGSAAACPPSYHTFRVTPPGSTQSVVLSAFNIGLNHDFTACVGLVASPIVSAAQMDGFIVYPLRP
jgi:hypothetical protein